MRLKPCYEAALSKTNEALLKKYEGKRVKTPDEDLRQYRITLTGEQREKFIYFHRWREIHARAVDESPEAIISTRDMEKLVRVELRSEEHMLEIIGNKTKYESISSWQKKVFELLTKGEEVLTRIINFECNNCMVEGGRAF